MTRTSAAARLRVGIDGGSWTNRRGYGRFAREIVRALAGLDRHRYTLFLDRHAPADDVPASIEIVRVATAVDPALAASADGFRSPADMLRMSRAMRSAPIDVLFFPTVYTFVPVLRRIPVLVGIHDAIAERFPHLVFATARARLFWRAKVSLALRQASLVLTVSSHARDGLMRHLHLPADRIRVTSEAPAAIFTAGRPIHDGSVPSARAQCGIAEGSPLIVYLGGIAPHKNLERLVRAFGDATRAAGSAGAKLVLVGDIARDTFHSGYPELRRLVDRDYADRVVFAGRLDDATLVDLLHEARAAALVSFDEGFGLPGVEAAACGAAVIATRESALPEVLGDAALFVDPASDDEIRAAIRRVLDDPAFARDLGARAAVRARALTWRAAAERVADVFDELAAGTAARP